MGLGMKKTDELIKIASAGGGFAMEGGRRTADELAKIAAAAKRSGALVVFRNMVVWKTDDLVRIASAGKGHVIFD